MKKKLTDFSKILKILVQNGLFWPKLPQKLDFFIYFQAKSPLYHPIFLTLALHTHKNQHNEYLGSYCVKKWPRTPFFEEKSLKTCIFWVFTPKILKIFCLSPEWQREPSVSLPTKTIHSPLMLNKTKIRPNNVKKWPKNGHFLAKIDSYNHYVFSNHKTDIASYSMCITMILAC